MRFVHFGHSCVLVETGDARLLFDPGTFSTGFEALTGLDAILVTHQHVDHLDQDRWPALLDANPGARVYVAGGLDGATTPEPGEVIGIGGTVVTVVDAPHEVIHPTIPLPANVGYLVDHGAFYHPGDSLFVPEQRVDVLGVPTAAPWMKLSEAADFLAAVSPRVAFPIHEKLLARTQLFYGVLAGTAPEGVSFRPLTEGEPVEL
ncbi:MBL fold metallo-hydrolase [Actinosynnema sp. NPDC020468]|uniref:MBL fold metallo-hydrolase n=1 Tax=Actinosynnema sp. NPDC020468 TaxID=3154488 RepID=UPI0033D8B7EE